MRLHTGANEAQIRSSALKLLRQADAFDLARDPTWGVRRAKELASRQQQQSEPEDAGFVAHGEAGEGGETMRGREHEAAQADRFDFIYDCQVIDLWEVKRNDEGRSQPPPTDDPTPRVAEHRQKAFHALRNVDEAAYVGLLHRSLAPGGLLMLLTGGCVNSVMWRDPCPR